ncbi:UNVERIFIED_CONTAM: hypothetical protein Slati_1448400 [Sesamum latifolium]|uniref:Uncharacterized protein n=1 Tax=Sesamum latifolium TaxID=2727402 RepID=A0AAW2X9R0_9LAMI
MRAHELARSLACSSQVASSPGPGRGDTRSRASQVAGWPAIYASWRRLIGLGRKV